VGIVGVPSLGLVFRGVVGGEAQRLRLAAGAPPRQATELAAIKARSRPARGLTATVSRSHLDATTERFLERLPVVERLACGSALKFCRLAEGIADVYPRLAPTCEWDVAAGHAVLAAAGGAVVTPEGQALSYGRAGIDFRIAGFVAWGDPRGATAASTS
jgi:3'(2'), 5'-bisphosphate nucleotidase